MDKNKFTSFIIGYISKNNIATSSTAIDSLTNSKYLNKNLLISVNDNIILKNTTQILNESIAEYHKRTENSNRNTKMRDIDVRPVLNKRFCSMPPFCKG